MFAVTVAFTLLATLLPVAQGQNAQVAMEYPAPIQHTVDFQSVNFTELFSYPDAMMPHTWAKETWNGVTTFARTTPLRCFGSDADVPYDVAVLGENVF